MTSQTGEQAANGEAALTRLRAGFASGAPAVWLRPGPALPGSGPIDDAVLDEALRRLARFRPALQALFPGDGFDGRIGSPLLSGSAPAGLDPRLLIKADHALPMTGSVKARGGVYELLCFVERAARAEGLLPPGCEDYAVLATPAATALLGRYTIAVASTGNLGFSIGLVGRAFGLKAEVHMSVDAQSWKKDRLRGIGVRVVEHDCDYTETMVHARDAAAGDPDAHFVDDESSMALLVGYAAAGRETAAQLQAQGIEPTPDRPLVVYLPCGLGGAPAGIALGLRAAYPGAVIAVFAEPLASACMFVAMAAGRAASVYEFGLDNRTLADGLAVPRASELVLEQAGHAIDAVVAVSDSDLLRWMGRCWAERQLRLEPSAAAGFAAAGPFLAAVDGHGTPELRERVKNGHHLVWTTGGSLLPDAVFARLLADAAAL